MALIDQMLWWTKMFWNKLNCHGMNATWRPCLAMSCECLILWCFLSYIEACGGVFLEIVNDERSVSQTMTSNNVSQILWWKTTKRHRTCNATHDRWQSNFCHGDVINFKMWRKFKALQHKGNVTEGDTCCSDWVRKELRRWAGSARNVA
jgi:hypothetical protein